MTAKSSRKSDWSNAPSPGQGDWDKGDWETETFPYKLGASTLGCCSVPVGSEEMNRGWQGQIGCSTATLGKHRPRLCWDVWTGFTQGLGANYRAKFPFLQRENIIAFPPPYHQLHSSLLYPSPSLLLIQNTNRRRDLGPATRQVIISIPFLGNLKPWFLPHVEHRAWWKWCQRS